MSKKIEIDSKELETLEIWIDGGRFRVIAYKLTVTREMTNMGFVDYRELDVTLKEDI